MEHARVVLHLYARAVATRARVDVRRPRVLCSSETLVTYASLPRRFPVTVCFDFRLRVARFLT